MTFTAELYSKEMLTCAGLLDGMLGKEVNSKNTYKGSKYYNLGYKVGLSDKQCADKADSLLSNAIKRSCSNG